MSQDKCLIGDDEFDWYYLVDIKFAKNPRTVDDCYCESVNFQG